MGQVLLCVVCVCGEGGLGVCGGHESSQDGVSRARKSLLAHPTAVCALHGAQ